MMDSGLARLFVRRIGMLAVLAFGCVLAQPSNAGTTTYTYDVHGRIQTVTTPVGTDQNSTTYTFDAAGNRVSVVSIFSDLTPPNPPTGLTAVAQASDRIRLNWSTSVDSGGGPVSYYKVYRGGTSVASPAAPPYDDQPLSANTPYSYSVSAVDPAGHESTSNPTASATTLPPPDLTPPSVPANLQGTAVSGTWINLTWNASTDTGGSGLAGYEIFRDGSGTPLNTSTVASYSDQTLSPATTHTYKVRSYDVAGNRSAFSNQISVTTLDTVAPGAPGNPTMSAITINSATATWTAATDNVGVTGYRYSLNGGSSWTTLGVVLTTNLTGLTPATAYTIQVQARDAAGNWGANGSKAFTTLSDTTAPSAPGTPTMSVITINSATATWTAATDNVGVTGYRYSLNGGSSWTTLGNVLTTNLTGLTPATAYTIQVQARDAASNWGASSSKAFTTSSDATAPSAPGTPTMSAITVTAATATWTAATDNVGVTGYRYSLNGGTSWTTLGVVLTTNLTGLTPATAYTIQVQARDAASNWGASGSKAFTTLTDTTAPSAPGVPTMSAITVNSATASWTAATDNAGVTGYRYSLNGGTSWTTLGVVLTTNVTGLTPATAYTIQVQARDAAGNWGASGSKAFTTLADTTAPSAPGAPTMSAITINSATATWAAATDNVGVTGYRYSLNGGSSWTTLGNVLTTGLTGLSAGTGYTIQVQARDAAGNWGASGSGSFTTLSDTTAPSAPGNPTFSSITSSTATATWTAATDNIGVTGYRYSLNGGSSWTTLGNVLTTGLTGLSSGASYTMLVQARDAAGNWGASGSGPFTTIDVVAPGAPGNPTFSSIAGTSATASWTAATDNVGVTGYRYSLNGGSSWTTLGNVLTTSLSGLSPGTSYTMLVQAGDAAGFWGASGSALLTTIDAPPTVPGNASFSSITGSSATASWTAASDDVGVTGYRYSLNGGSSWTSVGNALSASLSGLTRATGYTMLVQAGDAAGHWGPSSSGGFTTATYYTDYFTMSAGTVGDGTNSPVQSGYQASAFGSLTPTTTVDGKTIAAYFIAYQLFFDGANWTSTEWTFLQINGFSGNPGQGWLQSITGAGTGASATLFGCNGGVCVWQWPTYSVSLDGSIAVVHQ